MNGIINLYKPPGITSHTAVSKIRHILQMKKVGHTGTLDPDAEGVLPICIGKGTKVSGMLTDTDKSYRAVIRFGVVTDTQDMCGKILTQCDTAITCEQLEQALPHFTGEIQQIPPMYSAIKIGGKKLYELARQGEVVERPPRKIMISELQLLDFDGLRATIDVTCSKGTYIRTLCHDIGQALGCGAAMEKLIRTRSGMFQIQDSVTFSQLQQDAVAHIIPLDQLFLQYPPYTINSKQEKQVLNGAAISTRLGQLGQTFRIYNEAGTFLCLSTCKQVDGKQLLCLTKAFY